MWNGWMLDSDVFCVTHLKPVRQKANYEEPLNYVITAVQKLSNISVDSHIYTNSLNSFSFVVTFILTESTDQSLSWEADSFLASREISCVFMKPESS
jgi:hypothetical protein